MQIIIKGRQMQVTPQLRERIQRKVQRLERLLEDEARVEVTVTEERTRSARDRFSVQLSLSSSTHPVRSEVSALNASTALDLALDKVVAQLGRQKDRQKTVFRQHSPAIRVLELARTGQLSAVSAEEVSPEPVSEEQNEEMWSRIMEIRRLPTRPMTDQEVIAHMEQTGALFYPFFNEESNSVNVMYKLEQGGYGLLLPDAELATTTQPARKKKA
jgi:putative sigma-54 modulation protein